MDPFMEILQASAGFLFFIGICIALFGKKLFDLSNIIIGAVSGFIFGFIIFAVTRGSVLGILAILFFTIAGAWSSYTEPYAIVATIAFLPFFFATIYVILESGNIWYGLIPLFLGGIVAGIVVELFKKYLIFTTSLLGGVLVGLSIFATIQSSIITLISLIIVCIVGIIFQNKVASVPPRVKKEEGMLNNTGERIEPQDIDKWLFKGYALSKEGRYKDALKCAEKVLKNNPNNTEAWHLKGGLLFFSGEQEAGLKCFDKALELDPKRVDTWAVKGNCLYDVGRYEEAISCCNRALELDPSDEYVKDCKKNIEEKLKSM